MKTKLNPEDFTDESACKGLTYTELETLNVLSFLYDLDKQSLISLLLSIVADANVYQNGFTQYELIEYLSNWNINNEFFNNLLDINKRMGWDDSFNF